MFKGEPAIHYSHSAQTIKVAEVTMENVLSLGVWTQGAHGELKWLCSLGSVSLPSCSLSVPLTARKHTVPVASKNALGLPWFPLKCSCSFCWWNKPAIKEQPWWQLCDMYTSIVLYHISGRHQSSVSPLFPVELGCCVLYSSTESHAQSQNTGWS